MNGIHDMGGMHGFGLIDRDEHPSADWERRVFALMEHTLASGLYNLDAFRYGIEQMPPAGYLQASYYERWLATVEYNLVQSGVLAEREVDSRLASVQSPPGGYFQAIGAGPPPINRIHVPENAADAPRFAAGDPVMTRNINPAGHTRLPRYARGKRGVINRVYSTDPLPDTNAHGLGEHRQPVYSVRFDGRDLWGAAAEPNMTVAIDLWECYLEPFGSEE